MGASTTASWWIISAWRVTWTKRLRKVPFVRLVLDFCGAQEELTDEERKRAMLATLEMVDRITQEVRSVGFWKKANARELLTRRLVRDLDEAGICPPETQRDLAQRLVALARENHENLTR
jgi:type I restriction enzyme R subunit